jgi:L-aspartate oxidase
MTTKNDRRNGTGRDPAVGVTVDVVALTIRDGALKVMLIERERPPFAGTWALPGAFVAPRADGTWETLEELAARTLAEESGVADLGGHHLEQLATFGDPDRDPRMRVISIGYLMFAPDLPEAVAGRTARTAEWVRVEPGATGIDRVLAFDHAEILAAGLERARARLEYTTLATTFLPALFTLSDLQSVYEAVWGTDLDLSNLRRKVLGATGFVAPTGLAATRSPGERGRPAELYQAGAGAILNPPITRPATRATPERSLPQRTSTDAVSDVVVVGAGIAGLTAALTAADRGARVLLLVKGRISEAASSSWLAQGGVAAVQGPDDDPALHIEDTLVAGRGLCRLSAVETLVHEIPARVAELRRWGVAFDDDLGLEGGHSRRRIAHVAGAETGRAITQVLVERVLADPRITIAESERALRLIPGSHLVTDRRTLGAPTIILATGGYAALWSRTSNPVGSIGEGLVIAWQAGARLADMEFVQFHPTVLVRSGLLLSEALRGDGATLIELDGSRFIDELAPRDVVARAVAAHPDARLDLRPIDQHKFTGLMDQLMEAGYLPDSSPIPVQPAAHFSVGGIVTDLDGSTGIDGLYAAGECANTGLHGANRLASNSLAECLVFGRRAAIAAVAALTGSAASGRSLDGITTPAPGLDDGPLTEAEREALWRGAGLTRDAAGLSELLSSHVPLIRMVAASALSREESRGGHFRSDFPELDPSLDGVHTVIVGDAPPNQETWL